MNSAIARVDIAEVAREWIGTPFQHQASSKGHGADCLGLVRGVWRETLNEEPEMPPAYSPDWAETLGAEILLGAIQRHFIPVERNFQSAGSVVAFRLQDVGIAKHLGILSGWDGKVYRMIHSYSGTGVVETPITPSWQRRCVGQFEFPLKGR